MKLRSFYFSIDPKKLGAEDALAQHQVSIPFSLGSDGKIPHIAQSTVVCRGRLIVVVTMFEKDNPERESITANVSPRLAAARVQLMGTWKLLQKYGASHNQRCIHQAADELSAHREVLRRQTVNLFMRYPDLKLSEGCKELWEYLEKTSRKKPQP